MRPPLRICKLGSLRRLLAVLCLVMLIFMVTTLQNSDSWKPLRVGHQDRSGILRNVPALTQVQSKACRNITVTSQECRVYKFHEFEVKQRFPLHFVSGAPGSGNDWIRWLASINKYTPYTPVAGKRRYAYAVYGSGYKLQPDASKVNLTDSMFFKSHEPWWNSQGVEISSHAKRAALLLRHPFDACYSEFKRELLGGVGGASRSKIKNAAVEVHLNVFIDEETGQLNTEWKNYLMKYIYKWVKHASYWLTEYDKPLHVIIYNTVRNDTAHEVESLQEFFGYNFDGPNIRRHCCVMADSMNPVLKRRKSAVDTHKEDIYSKDASIIEQVEAGITRVHEMLDSKYPGKGYRITRG